MNIELANGLNSPQLLSLFDPTTGQMEGAAVVRRNLSDLRGIFADDGAFEQAVAESDPVVYSVQSIEPGVGDGDLHYGVGVIQPGSIGGEYYMTRGHLHSWRDAAEVYIGLSGSGLMLLEQEHGGESVTVPLVPNGIVYVPGHTAHRTINTGDAPLVYIGIFPARAGHDYGAIADRNFAKVVVAGEAEPLTLDRDVFLKSIASHDTARRT